MDTELIDRLSGDINLNRDTLISKGIQSFLKEKKTALMLERLELLSRYGATSRDELQHKIEIGQVEDHPAWEDLILIENLEAEVKRINEYLEGL